MSSTEKDYIVARKCVVLTKPICVRASSIQEALERAANEDSELDMCSCEELDLCDWPVWKGNWESGPFYLDDEDNQEDPA